MLEGSWYSVGPVNELKLSEILKKFSNFILIRFDAFRSLQVFKHDCLHQDFEFVR